ncbi:hypothetical protein NX059_012159 [Plenodomus lindquistii]|nr:hypothetical protein NX059_012159 [Plenodomus lindquistii]
MLFLHLVASALCVLGVQGIPAQGGDVLDRRTVPAKFVEHARAAIQKYAIGNTRTMMHSGIGPAQAFRIARMKGLQTIETTIMRAILEEGKEKYQDTLAKYCVGKQPFCERGGTEQDWVEAWAQVSKEWANYAKEQTTLATHSGGPDAASFYKRIEEPILQAHDVQINVENSYTKGS